MGRSVAGSVAGVSSTAGSRLGIRPNPAATQTRLRFVLPAEATATLEIFDVRGRRVRGWRSERPTPGEHEIYWDLRDSRGTEIAAGVYLARLRVEDGRSERTLRQKVLRVD